MASKKLEILKELTALLKTVKSDGNENINAYSLENAVFRGRTVYGDNDPVPLVSILEAKGANFADFADDEKIANKTGWNLLIQGWADPVNPENETDAVYELVNDVICALNKINAIRFETGNPLYPEFYRLGGKIIELTLGDEVVRPSENELSSKAFFYLPIVIGITNQ